MAQGKSFKNLWLMAYHLKIVSKNKLKKTRKNA